MFSVIFLLSLGPFHNFSTGLENTFGLPDVGMVRNFLGVFRKQKPQKDARIGIRI